MIRFQRTLKQTRKKEEKRTLHFVFERTQNLTVHCQQFEFLQVK